MTFERGCRYDDITGKISIYMIKPKYITKSLKNRAIKIDGINLTIDEFLNKRDIIMLSFNGIINGRQQDLKSTTIYLRGKLSNEIQSLFKRGI